MQDKAQLTILLNKWSTIIAVLRLHVSTCCPSQIPETNKWISQPWKNNASSKLFSFFKRGEPEITWNYEFSTALQRPIYHRWYRTTRQTLRGLTMSPLGVTEHEKPFSVSVVYTGIVLLRNTLVLCLLLIRNFWIDKEGNFLPRAVIKRVSAPVIWCPVKRCFLKMSAGKSTISTSVSGKCLCFADRSLT